MILFDGDLASFDMIWCSNARGPNIGIIADYQKKEEKMNKSEFFWYGDFKQNFIQDFAHSFNLHAKWWRLFAFAMLI